MAAVLPCRSRPVPARRFVPPADVWLAPPRFLFAALEAQSRRLPGGRPGGDGVPEARSLETDPDRDLLPRVLEEYPHGTRWFARLVTRHWPRARAICQAVLLDGDDADDATQEAFLKAHRYLHGFRFECSFGTWLARIARTSALDVLAARSRESAARARIAQDPVLSVLWSPWRAPVPGAGEARLRRALERMSPSDRLVLVLHDVEGVEYDELAEVLELAPAAVRMRMSRARERLRAVLHREEAG